jgi:DNA-binding transcriptional LysR family regulator
VRSGLGISVLPHLEGGRWRGDTRLRVIDIPGAEVRRIGVVQARESAQAGVIAAVIAAVTRELQGRLQA